MSKPTYVYSVQISDFGTLSEKALRYGAPSIMVLVQADDAEHAIRVARQTCSASEIQQVTRLAYGEVHIDRQNT